MTKQTVRAASEADGLVSEMRQLAQAVVPGQTIDDPAYVPDDFGLVSPR